MTPPETAEGSLFLRADLRASRFDTGVLVAAPEDGKRSQTRINWLLRQLDRSIPGQVVEVAFANTTEMVAKALSDIEGPDDLVSTTDAKRMPRRFTVTVSRKMGARRAGGRGFVSEAESQVVDFYRDVVQALKAWQPSAPKLPAQIATPERAEMDQPLEQAAPAYLEETRGEYEHSTHPAS